MASLETFGHTLMLQALRSVHLGVLHTVWLGATGVPTLFSWAFFGQVPDLWMTLGILLIALGGTGTVLLHARARGS